MYTKKLLTIELLLHLGSMSIDVFTYLDPSQLLRSVYKERQKKNPAFSIRAWSKKLDLKSHNTLYEILRSKRTIPRSLVPALVKDLGLNKTEAQFFTNMIELNKAKTVEQKNFYLSTLRSIKPRANIHLVEVENYHLYDNPLHFVLMEMVARKDFKYDLHWIQERLPGLKSLGEIEEMIERLVSLGYIKEVSGTLYRSQDYTTNTLDLPSKAIRSFHKKVLQQAAIEIDRQSVEEREFSAFVFNVKKQDITRAKKFLRDMNDKFIKEFEAISGTADQTYNFQMQFFKSTKK